MPLLIQSKRSSAAFIVCRNWHRCFLAGLIAMLVSMHSGHVAYAQSSQSTNAAPADPASEPAAPDDTEATALIGLNATLSGSVGQSGIAIERGLQVAIEEINAAGGVLGNKLKLVIRDNRGVPARGLDNTTELAALPNLVAIVGGIHSPTAIAQLEEIHRQKVIYLGAWAAATQIVDNGYEPNFVFRVSARDELAGRFLIGEAIKRGFRKPGLLLWRTGWGRSNEKAMKAAAAERGMELADTSWFNTSQSDMTVEIDTLRAAGADVIMLVANATEGLAVIRNVAAQPADKRLPIISHWGITGGNVFDQAPEAFRKVELSFLQTYSFFDPPFAEKARRFSAAYCRLFGACGSPSAISSPVGSAHAYDLAYLLRNAIEKARTTDRIKVRAALEQLGPYRGLVRVYDPAFTPQRHDALDMADFRLCQFNKDGDIIPQSGLAGQ